MTTYAIVATAVICFILGWIAAYSYEAWLDGRFMKRHNQMVAARRASLLTKAYEAEEADAAMDEAVALVKNELGGTILSYKKS